MGMSEFHGARDDRESTATIHRAFDLGINFLDTADMSPGMRLTGRSNGDHLESLQGGLRLFAELAEIEF